MFLPFYVLATLICDIVRIRTLVLTGFLDSGSKGFFVAFAAAFALRGIMCLTENIEKGWIIEELHVVSSIRDHSRRCRLTTLRSTRSSRPRRPHRFTPVSSLHVRPRSPAAAKF